MTEISDFTTGFWSGWVVVITVTGLFFLGALLYFVAGPPGRAIKSEDEVWDSDLREGNAEPPKWWFFLYLSMIIFSCAYLVLYPGLGSWKGTLAGLSSNNSIKHKKRMTRNSVPSGKSGFQHP